MTSLVCKFQHLTTTVALTLTLACLGAAPAATLAVKEGRVISTLLVDLQKSGKQDRVVLVVGKDDRAELQIFFAAGTGTTAPPGRPSRAVASAAYHDETPGRGAHLEAKANGAILIKSGNTSVGRDRWTETLTVVYRDNELVVAGITLWSRDAVAGSEHTCDLNLFTGEGTLDGRAIDAKLSPFKLSEWKDTPRPEACVFSY